MLLERAILIPRSSADTTTTMGESIPKSCFSVTLRGTVLRMLTYKWKDRLTSRELLKICRDAIKICDNAKLLLKDPAILDA